MYTKLFTSIIFFLGMNGLCAQEIHDVISTGIDRPVGLYIADDVLYFTEYYEGGRVLKLDLNTPNATPEPIATNIDYAYGLSVWNDQAIIPAPWNGTIWKKGVSSLTTIYQAVITGLEGPLGIAVRENDLYFTHYLWSDSSSQIIKAPIDQFNGPSEIIVEGLHVANALTFGANDDLYVLDNWAGSIYKLDLSAPEVNIELLASGFNNPNYFYYWESENKLLISERNTDEPTNTTVGKISSIPLDEENPTPTILLSDLAAPTGLFVHGSDLYFGEFDGNRISKVSLDFIIDTKEAAAVDLPRLYPSPASTYIMVDKIDEGTPAHIINLQGRRIKTITIQPGVPINISGLNTGSYFLQMKGRGTLPFVKQ